MSKLSIHEFSAPIFVALLTNLDKWLDKAKALADERKFDVQVLLDARLAPDMIPFHGQVRIATGWAKNCQMRLAGQEPVDFPDTDVNFDQLKARITRTLDVVQSISAKDLEGSETRTVTFNMGPEIKMSQTGLDYLNRMALPNFYFHISTAYDILRHNGVQLGKIDFLTGLFELPKR